MNTSEIMYRLEDMRKITQKQLGMDDKMDHFRWIARLTGSNSKYVVWVVGVPSVVHQKIEKNTLNFEAKA